MLSETIPEELVQRGFAPKEAYGAPWSATRVFRKCTPEGGGDGLQIGVWESENYPDQLPTIMVYLDEDWEDAVTVATGHQLAELLPCIDALIAACDKAPFVDER